MKKSLLLSCLFLCSTAALAQNYKGITTCEFDYDDENFCSKENIQKYKHAFATMKPNFDSQYILINIGIRDYIRYVALDTKTGIAYPLPQAILGFTNQKGYPTGKQSIINYSIYNKDLCVKGTITAFRQTYDNVKVCYSMQKNQYSPYGKSFEANDLPKDISN